MIKGKYVGLITLEYVIDENEKGLKPFDEMQASFVGELGPIIEEILIDELDDEFTTVKLEQQFAELYKEGDLEKSREIEGELK